MTLMLFFIGMGIAKASTATSLLMPKPHELTENGASFDLNRTVSLDDPTGSSLLASLFTTGSGTASVTVNIVSAATLGTFDYTLAGFDNEGYKLNVTTNDITITAASKTGVIRAAQTLMQLKAATDGAYIPGVEITDYPAFKLRGYMHDVGRSFISFAELKKEIDLLSRFKVNVFHWHLTDNQGFRFESQQYPQLNQASNMTRFAGSYYTQAQCTELEAYAAERGVIVIPEIDMPGHSTAFTNAMGFTMSSDDGKAALKVLLGELASAFPLAPYIHMGADEAGTTAAFVNEMSQYIKETLGRKCIVWNPISGVTINTTNLPYIDMTEMWSTSGTKITGLPNIDCRYNYINHFDVFADLVGIYKSNVYYASQGSAEVAGAITAIWNDRKTATETDIISQNGLYANALATAERGWMGGGNQYIEVGGTTLPNSGSEFEEFADWERRFLHYKDTWLADEPIPYVKQTNVKWRITQAFPNGGTASAVFPPEQSTAEILPDEFTYNDKTYAASMATGAGIYLRHVWGTNVPAFFASPQLNTTAYAWTYVYSPIAQTAGALIEFQNYSRSENDKAPDAGNWDRKGSRIWVNGEEVLPPTWTNSGKSIGSEVDLGNENFPARTPISISLKAGWNKVFLKLPYVSASNIRLNKWMFTFVLTDATGRNALDGITYSPIQSLDENVESVVALIGEVKQYVNEKCGTAIGYYPLSAASTLMAKVEEIESTLQTVLTAEQRAAQETELQTAFATFKSGLSSQSINLPLTSTDITKHYYTLCTPLRGTRYVTATGTASEVGGISTISNPSYWTFVERTDGTLDIVNAVNGSYIAPNGTNNSALKTQTSQPSSGWTMGKAATAGYVTIVSGTCQFNQTNQSSSALSGGYRVFNWGNGTNTTDTGCQYLIEEVDVSFGGDDVLDGGDTSDGSEVLNVGSQVTTEAGITSGKVYLLKTGANAYITDNGTNYDVPNVANPATAASAYYLISNGDGTWKIKNYYTGKYWGVPVYNTALASVEESSAGAWSLNFSSGVAYPSCPDANSTVRGIDRSSQKVWGWSTGTNNNHKVYIYEVPLSEAASFDEFTDKGIEVGTAPASTISTATWYVMSQRSRTSYVFEDVSSHTLRHTLTKPSGLATDNANYLIRLVSGTDGKYYLQNGLGNYMGQVTVSTNVPTTALKEQQHTVAKISGVNEHYYIQCSSNNVILDANDFSLGDPSTVVGWGTSAPSSTGGNNDWAFYPVELTTSTFSFLIDNVNVSQGNQTTGKGNTMQALLRVKVTPFANYTPTKFDITLTGADQLSKVAVYTTTLDEILAPGATPVKIGEADAVDGDIEITVNSAEQIANTALYYWITADVKVDATELATFDASLNSIAYVNSNGDNVCDVASIGNPDGEMRIYKQQTYLWTPTHNNKIYYRIPTMLNTKDGGIIALVDYRHDHPYDLGKSATNGLGPHVIDVVARKSADGGLTWGQEQTIAAGDGTNAASYGYGDPAIVADADGTLHCLMAAGSTSYASGSGMLHMGYTKSTDNGATWSAVRDIYDDIDKAGLTITSAFTTGGKGVTFSNGRMAFAFLGKVGGTTNIYPLYSDDKGATWHVQPTVAYGGGDESKFEIMNDNSLLLSVRKGSYNGTAVRSYNRTTGDASGDGIGSWGTASNWGSEMNANGCNADILYYSRSVNGERDVLLHTLTKSYSTYRKDLRLYMSLDQGETWKEIFQLQPGYAAYSSMQKLANGDLAVIYEDGSIGNQDKQDCYAINYVVISKELLEEKIDEQYDASQCPTVTITDQGVTNGSAPYGTWSPASGWANTFTSNATSGLAGVVVSADYNAFNRESDYGQRVFCLKPSAAGATDIITLTAPDGYVIDGYSVGGRYYTGSETYTLTAEDGTSVAVNLGASGTPGYLTTSGLNAKTTTITFSNSNSSNNRYACLTHFTVTLRAATDITLTACGGRSYATLFLSDGVTITEDVKAYKISLNGEWAVPVELGQEIPASTPVMLCSETAKTSAKAIYNGSATADVGGNLLAGNSVKQHVDGYVLNIVEGVPGFYKLSASGKLNANRAYLPTSVVTGNVKGFAFNWDIEDGMETTVPGVQSLDKAVYDLSGRRIEKPTRGVYIVNGKKVVVK